jgi:hypothetical protein
LQNLSATEIAKMPEPAPASRIETLFFKPAKSNNDAIKRAVSTLVKNCPYSFLRVFGHLRYEVICFLTDDIQHNSKIHKINVSKMTVQEPPGLRNHYFKTTPSL